MPRKRCRKKRGPNNIQNKLATRLMQISLNMDDHIYCNKPVSRATAKELLQEVATLKKKCPRRDVRALQVVDKITTFMKHIIANDLEQKARLPTPTTTACIEFSQSHSPVYSLPDEDSMENATVYSFPDDIPMIDITEDSNDTVSNEQNNVIDNVNFENMTIQDDIESQIEMLSDDDCSQSILDDIHNANIPFQEDTRVVTVRMNDLINNNTVPQSTMKTSNGSLDNTTHNRVIIEPIKNIENPTPKVLENTASTLTTDMQQVSASDGNVKVVQRKKSNEIKKPTKKRKPKSKAINNDKATEIGTKINKPRNQKKKSVIIPIDAEPDGQVNGTTPKIYDRSIENDLSWVENLRFVRVVEPDENDVSLCNTAENFWDNFSLPSQWDEHDFEY